MNRFVALVALLVVSSGCATSTTQHRKQLYQATNPQRLTAQLHTQHHLFESCRSAHTSNGLNGTLILRFRVESNGRVSAPHIFEYIGQTWALDRCLIEAAQQLVFDPMPRGIVAEVRYPIEFSTTLTRVPASGP